MPEDVQKDPTRYELPLEPVGGKAKEPECSSQINAISEEALAANTLWFCRLRWIIISILAGFGALTLLDAPAAALGLRTNAVWAFACAGILVVCNIAYLIHLRLIGTTPTPRVVQANLWTQIVVDLLVLTGVVHFAGSLETHIANAYLFHIVLSCIFFTPRQSSVVTLLACVMFLACVLAELSGLLPTSNLHLDTSIRDSIQASNRQIFILLGSVWGIMLAVWYLASQLSGMLRKNQRDLAETNARLIETQAERTRHMMHTAHELKSPCAAIYSNAQVLIDGYCGDLSEEAVEILQKIAHRCQGLSSQVQDMLKLANLRTTGSQSYEPKKINVAMSLKSCIEHVTPTANHRNITIEAHIQTATTCCVEEHLNMFFLNLISNAVNYSNEGGTVHISCKLGADNRPHVTIRDEGIGIPSEKLPHIFDEYYRTTDAARHNRGSSGLGLAIVQQIAQAHRINLSVESRLGKGTVFRAILPPSGEAPAPEPGDQQPE